MCDLEIYLGCSFRLALAMPSLAMVLPLNNFWPWSFGHGIWWRKSNNLSLLSSTSDDVAAKYFSEDWKFLWCRNNCCTPICSGTLTIDSKSSALHSSYPRWVRRWRFWRFLRRNRCEWTLAWWHAKEAVISLFFSVGVVVVGLSGTAGSVDVDDVSMSAKFICRSRRWKWTLLALRCVDVVGQSTSVVCILPGTDTEVVSVFSLVEIFTFTFWMGIAAACWSPTAAAAAVGLVVQ